jgi:AraC-like DNA-binding protein
VRDVEQIAADQLGHIAVQLILDGTAGGQADGRLVSTGPGDLMILDGARPYDISDGSDRRCVTVLFPRVMVATLGVDIDGVHGLVIGAGANALFSDHLRGLLPLLPTLTHAAGPRLARVLLDLFAVTLPIAVLNAPSVQSRRSRQQEALAERAYAWIEQNLASDSLSPDAIAKALRVSRSRLYQVFAGFGGIAAYVLFRRLANAHGALQDPADKRGIAELAYDCGFQSEAHFSRAFRAAYGLTASDLRRRGLP